MELGEVGAQGNVTVPDPGELVQPSRMAGLREQRLTGEVGWE